MASIQMGARVFAKIGVDRCGLRDITIMGSGGGGIRFATTISAQIVIGTIMPSTSSESLRLTPIQWLICVIAVIGFAFDTYVLLMLPLIIRPAVEGMGGVK